MHNTPHTTKRRGSHDDGWCSTVDGSWHRRLVADGKDDVRSHAHQTQRFNDQQREQSTRSVCYTASDSRHRSLPNLKRDLQKPKISIDRVSPGRRSMLTLLMLSSIFERNIGMKRSTRLIMTALLCVHKEPPPPGIECHRKKYSRASFSRSTPSHELSCNLTFDLTR